MIAAICELWNRTRHRYLPWFPRLRRRDQEVAALLVLIIVGTGDPLKCLWHCTTLSTAVMSIATLPVDAQHHHATRDSDADGAADGLDGSGSVQDSMVSLCHPSLVDRTGPEVQNDSSFVVLHEHTAALMELMPAVPVFSLDRLSPATSHSGLPQLIISPPLRPPISEAL